MAQPSGKASGLSFGEVVKSKEFLKHAEESRKKSQGASSSITFAGMDTASYQPTERVLFEQRQNRTPTSGRLSRRTLREKRARALSRSPSPEFRNRSRSPIRERETCSYRHIEFGTRFVAKPLVNREQAAKEAAERSHGVLNTLSNIQTTIGAGGSLISGVLWLTSKLPGGYGEMAARLRPLFVDNNSAVFVDVREALQLLFSFSDDELFCLGGKVSYFAIRISGDDIRIYEYPQNFRCASFKALRDDYQHVQNGGASDVGMDYEVAEVCCREEFLAKVMNILFSCANPQIVDHALKGNIAALREGSAVVGGDSLQEVHQYCFYKVTLICMRESLDMLVAEGDQVFWEAWPGHKERWPFSDKDTPAAISYLKRYFNLLIDKKFEEAKAHFEAMGDSLGGNVSALEDLFEGLQQKESPAMELNE